MEGQRGGMFTLLVATLLVLGFAGLNISRYVFASSALAVESQTQLANGLKRIIVSVEGVSCVACEIPVRHALRRIEGVKSVDVNAAAKTATVDYEPAKTNPEQLVAAINATGFHAALPHQGPESEGEKSPVDSGGAADATAGRISVFKAPLVCPAAPQIGCGSASKPILLELEVQPGVLEAWLNRAGTRIAVVWKSDADATTRRKVVAELKQDHVTELDGKPREEAVHDFLSSKGWCHGADVDRLSEQEAAIIAARLVRWVQAKKPLAKDKAESLQHALTNAMRRDLTGESVGPGHLENAADVAREYLDQEQIEILNEAIKDEAAIENGEKPVPKEG